MKILTATDAYTLANDAYGILVKQLPRADATRLQEALASDGIETEVVPDASLPSLPQTLFVSRAECIPEGFIIYDPLNRPIPIEGRHVGVLAAGSVQMPEFKNVRTRPASGAFTSPLPSRRTLHTPEPTMEIRGREERCARLVLEIILGRAMRRYPAMAEEFNFKYLGQRATDSVLAKFALLVQDLARCAPHAFLNRGAFELRDCGDLSGDYPSRSAFHEETIWLLWQIAKAESPPA